MIPRDLEENRHRLAITFIWRSLKHGLCGRESRRKDIGFFHYRILLPGFDNRIQMRTADIRKSLTYMRRRIGY